MPSEKGSKDWQARQAAKQQREIEHLEGLRACRLAAALTQKELAELVGSSQTTIADLENWDKADSGMLRGLCRALDVAPEDLIFRYGVEAPAAQGGRNRKAEHASELGNAERRRQVNQIKRRAHYGGSPGTVLLCGLQGCRAAAGLTQRELANMVGTNQTTILQLEKGTRRGAYVSTVKKLCRALGVSPADVICK